MKVTKTIREHGKVKSIHVPFDNFCKEVEQILSDIDLRISIEEIMDILTENGYCHLKQKEKRQFVEMLNILMRKKKLLLKRLGLRKINGKSFLIITEMWLA